MSSEAVLDAPPRHDAYVIALIGLVHGVSHFFHLLLPPLFPWLMPEFGLDFVGIGSTMTVFFVVSGVGQALSGLAVDRFGPVRVLAAGFKGGDILWDGHGKDNCIDEPQGDDLAKVGVAGALLGCK